MERTPLDGSRWLLALGIIALTLLGTTGMAQESDAEPIVDEVVRMLEQGVSSAWILDWLDDRTVPATALAADDMIRLSRAEASDELVRRLMESHSNLYIELKLPLPQTSGNPPSTYPQNRPMDSRGRLRPDWLDLIRDFPDRVLLGSDTFFGVTSASTAAPGLELSQSLLAQLPRDLAEAVGFANANRVFGLRQLN